MNKNIVHLVGACAVAFSSLLAGCASAPPAAMRSVEVTGAPKPVGPYSQAVVINGFVYTAGLTGRNADNTAKTTDDITVQTNRTLDNLEAILAGAGCSFRDVVKVTVYMANIDEFAKMNEVYSVRMGSAKPARSTVQVARLPGGWGIEIDMVARLP